MGQVVNTRQKNVVHALIDCINDDWERIVMS